METITGTAAGVPFTALPPDGGVEGRAPAIVTWHMLDAPRTDAAFAAALPLHGVPAWRVHLGMPLCGARMVDGSLDRHVELAREDPLLSYVAPVLRQAADEFPAALAALRDQLPLDDGPVGLVGGSLGGGVALQVLVDRPVAVRAVALVNPAVRLGAAVGLLEQMLGEPYVWTAQARAVAAEFDFVACVRDAPAPPPVLLVSGEQDHPALRVDAAELVDALRERDAGGAELVTVPDLAHPLADEPGLEPAPQWPATREVDAILARWFRERLAAALAVGVSSRRSRGGRASRPRQG